MPILYHSSAPPCNRKEQNMATTSKTKKEKYIRQRRDGRWEARIKVGEKADGSPDIPSRYFSTRTEARAYVEGGER